MVVKDSASVRQRIVEEAATWLGTPYHHHGAVKGAGTDCAMLLVRVYQSAGLMPSDFDPRPYPTDWHMHRDAERYVLNLLKFGREVDKPKIGDAAVWKFGRTFSHGAIVTGGNRIIHSYMGRGVVADEMDQAELAGREVRFFSLIED